MQRVRLKTQFLLYSIKTNWKSEGVKSWCLKLLKDWKIVFGHKYLNDLGLLLTVDGFPYFNVLVASTSS